MKLFGFMLEVWLFAVSFEAFAGWQFGERIAVSGDAVEGTYHHLEGAGGKHISVSAGKVAVLWEDDSSGDPRI